MFKKVNLEKEANDDDFLCARNDEIDNAVFEAICSIALPETEVEWSMELIGEVNEFIEKKLTNHCIPTCHPWRDENECICYRSDERCPHCNKRVSANNTYLNHEETL